MVIRQPKGEIQRYSAVGRRAADAAPEQLAASTAVREILAEATSANTTRSYASALRCWAAWFQGRYGALALPVPEAAVVPFT